MPSINERARNIVARHVAPDGSIPAERVPLLQIDIACSHMRACNDHAGTIASYVDPLRARIAELEGAIRLIADEDCPWCRRCLPLVDDGIYRDAIWHRDGDELVGCRAARLLIATGVDPAHRA